MKHIDLGTIQGDIVFTPREPAQVREPIQIPRSVECCTVTFTVPDDAPIWRLPPVLAANAPNN